MAIQNFVPDGGLTDSDSRRSSIRPLGKEYGEIFPAPQVSVIVAADENGAIGYQGDMLWHLRADLRRFRSITTGHAVVMGRKTWESLPRRPLPGRLNIVMTRHADYQAPGAVVAGSLRQALALAGADSEIFIIGGGDVYAQALPLASRIYLTRILAAAPKADTFFPLPDPACWLLIDSETHLPADAQGPSFRFENYVRTGHE